MSPYFELCTIKLTSINTSIMDFDIKILLKIKQEQTICIRMN